MCEICSIIVSVCPPHAAEEVAEIAATFREAGLPGEFHDAAQMIYQRIADFKDAPATPALDDVLAKLVRSQSS